MSKSTSGRPVIMKNTHVVVMNNTQVQVLLAISAPTLRKWVLLEDDPLPRESDGTFLSNRIGPWYKRHLLKNKAAPIDDKKNPHYQRSRKDKEQADRYEMENQVRRKELVELSTVMSEAMDVMLRVRARMLRVASAVSPECVSIDDPIVIQNLIEESIRDGLTELASDWTEPTDNEQ